jgi:hypothetical protein
MQHFIVSRRLVEQLQGKGPFFQSPYPDYYAANVVLLHARTVVVNPVPLVMIGISPKSFGFYYYNQREGEGVDFLQNAVSREVYDQVRTVLRPGTNMNDSWLYSMETLVRNFPEYPNLRVNYFRYQLLQFGAVLNLKSWSGIPLLLRTTPLPQTVVFSAMVLAYAVAAALPRPIAGRLKDGLYETLSGLPNFDLQSRTTVPYQDILEAVKHYDVSGEVPAIGSKPESTHGDSKVLE